QLVTNRSHNVVVGATHAFSPTVSNNFVFNLSDFSNVILPETEGAPQINILGSQLWRSGTNYITPQTTFQERYQFRDDLTMVRGDHTIRFGGNFERTSINGQFAFAKPARIRLFDPIANGLPIPVTEADFLSYPVRDVSMGIGNDILPFNNGNATNNNRISFYGKDTWKLAKTFTLNYGLSYRVDSNLWNHDQGHPAIIAPVFGKGTAPSPKDTNNIAPTLGFAWDVSGNGRTVIRAGAGIYYDNTIDNLRLFERADLGPAGAELFLVGPDLVSTFFPGNHDGRFGLAENVTLAQALAFIPAARADIESHAFNCSLPTSVECFGSISGPLFSTEFQIPYSLQYSVGLQRELPGGFVFQGDFNYRKGIHEVIVYDVNHFGSEFGEKTTFGNAIPYADSSGFSTYMAGLFRLDRRFANGFQMTASYALSRFKAFGSDALGLGATVTDLYNLRAEFGPAGLDRTHRFVLSGIWDLPWFKQSDSWAKRNIL